MRILISTNETTHFEEVLLFSQQFIRNIDDPPTFLEILNPGNHRKPDQYESASVALKAQEFQTKISTTLGLNDFHARLRIGKPEEEILNEIHEREYDLVIFDDTGFRKAHLGFKKATAQRLAERAACSILILRGKLRPIHKILLCDSGAAESRLVHKFQTQVVDVLGEKEIITVLHVMSQISAGPGVRGKQLRADAEELIVTHAPEGDLLKQDMEALKESGLTPTVKIRHGLVVDEIMAEAHTGDYDLVVIGSNRERWQHILLEDLAQQIVKLLDQPILVIK